MLGQIFAGYLWSGRDEPAGLNYWTQRCRTDGSGMFEQVTQATPAFAEHSGCLPVQKVIERPLVGLFI